MPSQLTMHRFLAAGFILVVLFLGVVAFVVFGAAPKLEARVVPASKAGEASSLPDLSKLTMRVNVSASAFVPSDTARFTVEVTNPTDRTITALFPTSCTGPTLVSQDAILVEDPSACEETPTAVVLKRHQTYRVSEDLYLRHPQGAILADTSDTNASAGLPHVGASILELESGVTSYLVQVSWQSATVPVPITLSQSP